MQQETMEAEAREALWREELIEEIEQKVGGLREIEEASKKEELVKWLFYSHAYVPLLSSISQTLLHYCVYINTALRVK